MIFIYESFWFIIQITMPWIKRITNYCNYAIRNCDAGEGSARPQTPISNRCDTIWDIYAGEGVAIAKSMLSNRYDTIWDIYVSEGFATAKSTFFNRCDTIWDIYVSEGLAPRKSTLSNRRDTIWNCIVCFFCYVCNKSSFIFVEWKYI